MNELRRMAYLDALGIDSYVSRTQLPGAAQTHRLAIVPLPASAALDSAGGSEQGSPLRHLRDISPPSRRAKTSEEETSSSSTHRDREASAGNEQVPRFSLTAIAAGNWLWLEELAGMPLTTEQVRLIQSMAQALVQCCGEKDSALGAATRPEVAQFDWPIHNNRQLDQGEEAARAGVAGFVGRRLEQYGCAGLVLLGQTSAEWVPVQQLGIFTICTASSAEMLVNPALKSQVWQDLLPLAEKP